MVPSVKACHFNLFRNQAFEDSWQVFSGGLKISGFSERNPKPVPGRVSRERQVLSTCKRVKDHLVKTICRARTSKKTNKNADLTTCGRGNLLAFEVDFITAELQHLNFLEEAPAPKLAQVCTSSLVCARSTEGGERWREMMAKWGELRRRDHVDICRLLNELPPPDLDALTCGHTYTTTHTLVMIVMLYGRCWWCWAVKKGHREPGWSSRNMYTTITMTITVKPNSDLETGSRQSKITHKTKVSVLIH